MHDQVVQNKKESQNGNFFSPMGAGSFFSPAIQRKSNDNAAQLKSDPVVQRQEEDQCQGVDTDRDVRNQTTAVGTVIEVEAILRDLYQRSDEAVFQEAQEMIRRGVPESEVAQWAVRARNQAKVNIRQWDLDVLRIMAEQRNTRVYGDPVGPSYDQLRNGNPARNSAPRTDQQIINSARRSNAGVNRWVGRLRIAGRIMIAVDIGIGAYNVASAPEVDRPRVFLEEAGGLAGAAAGGWLGAKGGGAVGGAIGAFFGGAGAAPGAAIGAVVGGIGGAIAGGLAGRSAGRLVANELYPVEQTGFEGCFQ